MDRCHLEPGFRLRDDFSGLHELLRHAHGCAASSDGSSLVSKGYTKERPSSRVEWSYPAKCKCVVRSVEMAQAQKNIRQFDVRSISRWHTCRVHRACMAHHAYSKL